MIKQQLDALREGFPECELLALADIASGTVLCVSEDRKSAQEKLDGYCQLASQMLDGQTGQDAAKAIGIENQLNSATVLVDTRTVFLLRSEVEKSEAMLCVCTPEINTNTFLPAVQSALKAMAQEQ